MNIRTNIQQVMIIGAGRGGAALLGLFLEENFVEVIGIVDSNPRALGIQMAKERGVPAYFDVNEAIHACKQYPNCIIYNLTHDESITDKVTNILRNANITSGSEANFLWRIVTNLQNLKNEFEKSQNQLQAIIRNVMDGIITINQRGEIQGFNLAAEKIFGYSQQDVLGKNVSILMPEPIRSEHDQYIDRYLQTGHGRIIGIRGREVIALRKSGEQFPMELNASEMVMGGQRYFIGIVRDITERKIAEQKIEYLAHHDFLTGLPNRALLMDRLQQSIALAKRGKYAEAILFIDLDGFKKINDTLGHDAGDILLKEVALRLNNIVRTSDTVARVGGDEFVIVLNKIESEKTLIVVNKIIDDLGKVFILNEKQCKIGCSIGIAIFPDDSLDADSLLKQADNAMYLSKQEGKNTYRFYADIAQRKNS